MPDPGMHLINASHKNECLISFAKFRKLRWMFSKFLCKCLNLVSLFSGIMNAHQIIVCTLKALGLGSKIILFLMVNGLQVNKAEVKLN